jgi:acyl-CoA thioesterase
MGKRFAHPYSKGRMDVSETAASTHPFDRATSLQAAGDSVFAGCTSDEYWNFTGPFGGTTAATLLRAAMEHPKRIGTPLALTVNYCAPVAKGDFTITAREVRTNRSTQHWYLELSQAEAGTAATATAVFAIRRETWAHQPAKPPEVPPPEALPVLPTRGMMAWLNHYEYRFALNMPKRLGPTPSAEIGSTLSHAWIGDKPARALDFLSLAAMCDTFFGRIFLARGAMVPIGTVSMTTYFHVDADGLAAVGNAPLLGVADASVFTQGYADQTAQLWSRDGRLLATTQQIVYFRA